MPVLRSGTLTLHGFQFVSADNLWTLISGGRYSWPNATGTGVPANASESKIVCFGPTILDTTTEGTGLAVNPPPPGITPTFMNAYSTVVPGSGGTDAVTELSMAGVTRNHPPDVFAFMNPSAPTPTYGQLLLLATFSITGGSYGSVVWGPVENMTVTANYDIVATWWMIPAVDALGAPILASGTDACGNPIVSRLQLSATDPGAPWVRLDPLDENAAPVPIIDLVTPNHGVLAGGTAITIDGSGFGDGATVTVDGVAATSVAVLSQFRITCAVPAHAAGTVAVVVINPDGVTS